MKELEDIETIERSLAKFVEKIHNTYIADGLSAIVTKSVNQYSHVIYALYIIGKKDYNYRLLELITPIENSDTLQLRSFQSNPMEIKVQKPEDIAPQLDKLWGDNRFKHIIQHMKTEDEIING